MKEAIVNLQAHLYKSYPAAPLEPLVGTRACGDSLFTNIPASIFALLGGRVTSVVTSVTRVTIDMMAGPSFPLEQMLKVPAGRPL